MTIHTMGDSHCFIPFEKTPGFTTHWLGPVTLKRIGHPNETLLLDSVASIQFAPEDSLLLCFGEIDMRCWVDVHVKNRGRQPQPLLQEWIDLYLDKASQLTPKPAILGIVPPAPKLRIDRDEFPVAGSDQERAAYTILANHILSQGCAQRNLPFVDISVYADPQGMLRYELSDGIVHIASNTLLLKAIFDTIGKP